MKKLTSDLSYFRWSTSFHRYKVSVVGQGNVWVKAGRVPTFVDDSFGFHKDTNGMLFFEKMRELPEIL